MKKSSKNHSIALFFLINFLSLNFLFAQENSRTFSAKDFDKLDIDSAFTISVTQGNSFSVIAKGEQKDLEDIIAIVNNNHELHIGYNSKKWNNNHKKVAITITMPTLKEVHFSGASSSKISGFSSDMMTIDLSGASDGNFAINAKNLKVDCSGASNLTLVGEGNKMEVDISGASSLKAFNFKTDVAHVESSGASSAKVSVSSKLEAEASGASSIQYKGGASVTKDVSGASSVSNAN